MPDEGTTVWDDAIKGRIEYPNEKLEDLVLLRSDGRPTYNLAAAVDDADSAITHVIRGEDHVPNTPKQIRILEALGRPLPVYAHVPNVMGTDGKKLSKRHGAVSVEEFRSRGYVAPALMNYLALLGWSYDDKTTIMSRDELVERFGLERVGSSPATFDYDKLDWMNGVYLRELAPDDYAVRAGRLSRETGFEGDEQTIRASAPLVQEKIARLEEYPGFAGFLFERREAPAELLDGSGPVLAEARETLAASTRSRRSRSRPRCAGSPSGSARSRARRSAPSGRRSRARGSRPASSRASSSLGATSRWRGSKPRSLSPPRAGRGRSRRRRAPGPPPRRATRRGRRPR